MSLRQDEDNGSDSSSEELAVVTDSSDEIHERYRQTSRAEIGNLNQKLATLSLRLQEKDNMIHQEKLKVANLNLEILRVRLAIDQEARLNTNSHMMRLQSLLSDAERERDWFKDGVDEFRDRLKKSKTMNAALLDFLSQILVDGVYPECEWGMLKTTQMS